MLESVVKTESPRAVLLGSTSIGLDVGPLLGAKLNAPVHERLPERFGGGRDA